MSKLAVNGFKEKKNEPLKSLRKKYYKAQNRSFTVALQIIDSEILENSKKKKKKIIST